MSIHSRDHAVPETIPIQSGTVRGFVERRWEARIPCDAIPAQIRTDNGSEATVARILNISTSGVRLGMDFALEVGSNATVWLNNTVATGQVRYCRGNPDGSFDIGLRLLDVLNRI